MIGVKTAEHQDTIYHVTADPFAEKQLGVEYGGKRLWCIATCDSRMDIIEENGHPAPGG